MINQFSLFDEAEEREELLSHDGRVLYFRDFLENSDNFFQKLEEKVPWQQDQISMYGKVHDVPRLQAWFGEKPYIYSGIKLKVFDWLPELLELKNKIERKTGYEFNSALANYYRDGKDHVSWHADDEPELGQNPVIASLSFGQTRRFSLKHRLDKGVEVKSFDLENNSLLLMEGELQHFWNHRLHKTAKTIGPRINITFRKLIN